VAPALQGREEVVTAQDPEDPDQVATNLMSTV
jgi:hypothetical protein